MAAAQARSQDSGTALCGKNHPKLLGLKGPVQVGFVVKSPLGWKATTYRRYRCEPHWRTLIGWLESNGINARKKVHELRKVFGDAIVKRNGIFAGSAQLRHSTSQMTASHYTDPRQRAALPVGNLFSDGCESTPSENPQQNRQPSIQTQNGSGVRHAY